jgi:hypothetical protein
LVNKVADISSTGAHKAGISGGYTAISAENIGIHGGVPPEAAPALFSGIDFQQ